MLNEAQKDYLSRFPLCEASLNLKTPEKVDRDCTVHHINSRGNGGEDEDGNFLTLRHKYHTLLHDIGNKEFCIRYKIEKIREWLITRCKWTGRDEYRFTTEERREE